MKKIVLPRLFHDYVENELLSIASGFQEFYGYISENEDLSTPLFDGSTFEFDSLTGPANQIRHIFRMIFTRTHPSLSNPLGISFEGKVDPVTNRLTLTKIAGAEVDSTYNSFANIQELHEEMKKFFDIMESDVTGYAFTSGVQPTIVPGSKSGSPEVVTPTMLTFSLDHPATGTTIQCSLDLKTGEISVVGGNTYSNLYALHDDLVGMETGLDYFLSNNPALIESTS